MNVLPYIPWLETKYRRYPFPPDPPLEIDFVQKHCAEGPQGFACGPVGQSHRAFHADCRCSQPSRHRVCRRFSSGTEPTKITRRSYRSWPETAAMRQEQSDLVLLSRKGRRRSGACPIDADIELSCIENATESLIAVLPGFTAFGASRAVLYSLQVGINPRSYNTIIRRSV